LLLIVLALIVGACTAGDGATTDASRAMAEPATGAPATTAAPTADEYDGADTEIAVEAVDLGTGSVEPAVFRLSDLGRDIIFVADIVVAVTDVAVAGDAASREIAALGGFVFGQVTSGAPNPTTVLTFKVFPEDFQEALRRLGDLGELRSQSISADDVTERIVDIESRINTAEASVERLRSLLEGAGDINTIAQLESQLLERETQLETMRGQLRTLEDQVALATIVVTLTEALSHPAVQLDVSAYGGEGDAGQSCPGDRNGLAVDEGTAATVCFEVTNIGDTPLTAIELSDPVLDLTTDDLVVVFGSLEDVMEPGDSVMAAAEIVVPKDVRPQPRVSATPVDSAGEPIPGKTAAASASYFFDAVDPGGVPSFAEGLTASLDFLARMGRVALLFLAVLLPFVWMAPVAWLAWHLRRRRQAARPLDADELVASGGGA
jgi:hypothetical protein